MWYGGGSSFGDIRNKNNGIDVNDEEYLLENEFIDQLLTYARGFQKVHSKDSPKLLCLRNEHIRAKTVKPEMDAAFHRGSTVKQMQFN